MFESPQLDPGVPTAVIVVRWAVIWSRRLSVGGVVVAAVLAGRSAWAEAANYEAVSFVDARHGAVVVDRCYQRPCPRLFVFTGRGTFADARLPGPRRRAVDVRVVSPRLLFASRGDALYRRADGRWRRVFRRGVLAWDARSTGAWAVTRPCARRCALRLWHSFDVGRTWFWTALPDGARGPGLAPSISFADAASGAALYRRREGSWAVATTVDGGHRWRSRAAQCSRSMAMEVDVASAPGGALWLACGSEPSAGDQGHEVFVSNNGGRDFELRARHSLFQTPRPVGHGLIALGYLDRLVATSPPTAYLTLLRFGLLRTVDGGRTWRVLHGFPLGDRALFYGLDALPDGHVWQTLLHYGLFASADGGASWRHVRRVVTTR